MNPVTAIRLAVGGAIAAIILAFQFGILGHVAKMEKAMAGEETNFYGSNSAVVEGDKRNPAQAGWMAKKTGLLNIGGGMGADARNAMNPDAYSSARVLEISRMFTVDDFLLPGETRPVPEMETLFVELRAAGRMMDICAQDYVGALIRGCSLYSLTANRKFVTERDLTRAGSKPQRVPTEDFEVTAEIAFLPTILPGSDADKGGWAIDTDYLRFNESSKKTQIRVENTPEARAKMRGELMQAARLTCETIRDVQGTCAIGNLSFDETEDEDSDTVKIDARMQFYWLRLPTVPRDNDIIANIVATNPALPVLGHHYPPEPRTRKSRESFEKARERAIASERRQEERLARAEAAARGEAATPQEPQRDAGSKALNGGGALRTAKPMNGGGALNGGGVKFRAVD